MNSVAFGVFALLACGLIGIKAEPTFWAAGGVFKSLVPESGVRVKGDCSYQVTGGLTDPQPIFLRHNTTQFLLPNSTGVVEIENGQLFDMYCSKSFVAPFLNKTKITAQCLQGPYYLVEGIIREFKNFSCQEWAPYTARRTNRTCNGGTVIIEIGLEIFDGNFIKTIEVCHDEINEVSRYAHHKMNPSSQGYQRYVARPYSFITGDFYNGKDVNEVYTKIKQKLTFDKILGKDTAQYFNASDIYLARGHLSAKADHVYATAQRSTFFFVNAAPQWEAFNEGNWEKVERGVKKFVANQGIEVDCYTGTWGVSTLPDVNGIEKELYLDFDENNNGLISVPKIYFRVVVEPATKKGIVLIGVNNPHISLEQIHRDYVICDDVSEKISWIQWNKHDLLQGYMYACEVQQFREVVKDLPEFDVEELLY